jgi:hypothetical protein
MTPGTRENPVPLGDRTSLGNGWSLVVTGVDTNATEALLAVSPFARSPFPGFQYVLVSISADYTGPGSSHLTPMTSLRAVGASGFRYSSSNAHCGQLPEPNLDVGNPLTFSGGSIAGYAVCWMVRSSDVASLVMYYQPLLHGTAYAWLALE